ncbi:hypothetical protein SeLEV6574_g03236 [Synchytrium endobioticum]|uniref:Uncharacterized protein n=1 Tax=Synchytrium endobioticum TaxID=286115 RepID=A0A507D4L1_9FUNG|nr:hypothetical protein SeLEV6574_g03236 [Synchytrium endobioticum]
MSKHFIIVLLLFQPFYHGFAEDTDEMLREHTDAIHRASWVFYHSDRRKEIKAVEAVLKKVKKSPHADATVLLPLVTKEILKLVDASFPEVEVKPLAADMSQTELIFRWQAYYIAYDLLRGGGIPGTRLICRLQMEYWDELSKRVADAWFGPTFAFEHVQGQRVNWLSVNMLMVFEILRGARALESLTASNVSPVSSFTEAEVLLGGVFRRWWAEPLSDLSISVDRLYDMCSTSTSPEHLVYRMHYLKMLAQRSQFIDENGLMDQEVEQGLINQILKGIDMERTQMNRCMEEIRVIMRKVSERLLNMPSNVEDHAQLVTSEIVKLKANIAVNDYQEEQAIVEIRAILDAPHLNFIRENTGLLCELTAQYDHFTPVEYMVRAADYHLLVLWRCMQALSPLLWFKNRYFMELPPEDLGFTSIQVNGAVTEIATMAHYLVDIFDAYKGAAGVQDSQSHTSQLSDVEREECLGLIVQGRNHLASTWQSIIDQDADKYIEAVDSALANSQNFHLPEDVNALAACRLIQHVGGIPLKVHSLTLAYPVPENLPPDYLELAAKIHQLVVHRLYSNVYGEANGGGEEMNSKLSRDLDARSYLLAAYNNAAENANVRVLPDMIDCRMARGPYIYSGLSRRR